MLRCLSLAAAAAALPYPQPAQPVSRLFPLAEQGRSPEELLCLDSLAGQLAREKPQLFRVLFPSWATDADAHAGFLRDLRDKHHVAVDESLLGASLSQVLAEFGAGLQGFLRCDSGDASMSAALTLAAAGTGLLVAASDDVAGALAAAGLPQVRDLRGSSVADIIEEALPNLSSQVVVFQDASKLANLGDYAVFARAAIMEYGTDNISQSAILGRIEPPAAAFGWGPENDFVGTMNMHGAYVHASDWSKNLAALAGVSVSPATRERSAPKASDKAVHTVAFLMSDGDNIQWTIGDWTVNEKYWGSQRRGSVPVGWTFSPASSWLAPSVLQGVLATATENDELVAGPSGVGYMFPREYSALEPFTELTETGMKAADMRLLNVLGHDDEEPDLELLAPLLRGNDGIIYYSWGEGYAGHRGKLWWQDEKPVISSRFSLWGEERDGPMMGVQDLIQSILNMSRDPSSLEGYSLVTVHAWSHSYADILKVVDGLAGQDVDVVLPSELLRRVHRLRPSMLV